MDSAGPEAIQIVRENIEKVNPKAIVIDGASPIKVDDPSLIKGKRRHWCRRWTNTYTWRDEAWRRSCGSTKVRSC